MVRLISDRIELRTIVETDAHAIFSYRSDPEISRYQIWHPNSEAEVSEFIRDRMATEPDIPGSWLQLAICRRTEQDLIGDCGIRFPERETSQVEIGITIIRKFQRQGFAAEALGVLFQYIFAGLRKHRITASVDPRNTASRGLLEKMGMRQEAHFHKSIWVGGQWDDDVVYAILEEEWAGGISVVGETDGGCCP